MSVRFVEDWMTGADPGIRLRYRRWIPGTPKSVFLFLHGLSDHGSRYAPLAEALAAAGHAVVIPDLRGHGESTGGRGDAPSFEVFLVELRSLMLRLAGGNLGRIPWFLIGHSMGGLIALRHVQGLSEEAVAELPPLRGVILSAPWIATRHRIPAWKASLARLLIRVAPAFPVPIGLDPRSLTRDPVEIEARTRDPLCHDRCSTRLFRSVEGAQARCVEEAHRIRVPVLFLNPGRDPIADPGATTRLAESLPPGMATLVAFPEGLHEPFHDLDRGLAVQELLRWTGARIEGNKGG